MYPMCNLSRFLANDMLNGEKESVGWLLVKVCVYVCVMTAAPRIPANVLSVGFLKAGSLSGALQEPLRCVTFTTTGSD